MHKPLIDTVIGAVAARVVTTLGLLAALLLAPLVSPLAATLPAASAAGVCPSADGVVVVVDFRQLGGGVQQHCVAGSGIASGLFGQAGYGFDYVQRQPGFVCRVNGKPAADPCVNTPPSTAYWGLFWSDGRSGVWSYSTTGVQSLRIPNGGYVGFAWQGQAGQVKPGVAASPRVAPSPTPTPSPTASSSTGDRHTHTHHHASSGSSPNASAGSAAQSPVAGGPSPSASQPGGSASDKPGDGKPGDGKPGKVKPGTEQSGKGEPTATPTSIASPAASSEPAAASAGDDSPDQAGSGAPWWALVLVAGLLAGGAFWVRRKRSA